MAAANKAAVVSQKAAKGKIEAKKDDDPKGEKLAAVEDPLAKASKYIDLLSEFNGADEMTHVLAFDHHVRRRKPLLAMRALLRARRGQQQQQQQQQQLSPHLFERVALFFHAIAAAGKGGAADAAGAAAGDGAQPSPVERLGGQYASAAAAADAEAAAAAAAGSNITALHRASQANFTLPPFVPSLPPLHPAVAASVQAAQADLLGAGVATAEELVAAFVARANADDAPPTVRVAAARVLIATG